MDEVGALERTGNNPGLRFSFIEYAVVAAKLRGLFAKHGVVLVPAMADAQYFKDGKMVKVDMAFSLYNADDRADCPEGIPWQGEAGAHDDKGIAKAKTSGLKNFLMSLLLLSDKDDSDADYEPSEAHASPARYEPKPSVDDLLIKLREASTLDELGAIRSGIAPHMATLSDADMNRLAMARDKRLVELEKSQKVPA